MTKFFTTIALLGAVCAFSAGIFGRNGLDIGFGSAFVYDHAKQYIAGDAVIDGKVQALEIDWISGSVSVTASPDDTVTITEITDKSLNDDMRVHWWLDGSTLRIKFCASGLKLYSNYGKKALTVSVPETLLLSELDIDSASADVRVNAAGAKTIRVDTASGDVTFDNSCDMQSIRIDTASGKQSITAGHVETAKLNSASGSIRITADTIENLNVNTASGDIRCNLQEAPDECRIDTASGKVEVGLPEDAGFTLKVSTASGRLNSDFAMKKTDKTYTCGDGEGRIKIDTASGNINLIAK